MAKTVLRLQKDNEKGKAVGREGGPLVIERPDFIPIVDQLFKAKANEAAAIQQQKELRETLDPQVSELRDRAEAAGHFCKQVQVVGTDANAKYTFRDAFAPIDYVVQPQLQEMLGQAYPKLFKDGKSVRLKPGAEDLLLDLLGDLAEQFLVVDHHIEPVDDFRRTRFEMRDELSKDQNAALDEVVKQVGAKPALSFK